MTFTIGFDAKRALFNSTGLGNYSRNVILALQKYFPSNKYILFSPALKRSVQSFMLNPELTEIVFSSSNFGSLWRSFGIKRDKTFRNLDIYHGLSGEIPFGKYDIPTVVTIHDLIFLKHPHLYKLFDRKFYDLKMRYAAKNADAVIAISEATKQDIVDFYKINPEKIDVVYQSCHPSFMQKLSTDRIDSVRKKYSLPGNYILNVSTVEKRKNILSVIKAMHEYKIDFPLVVAGRKTDYFYNEIEPYITQHNFRNVYFIKPDFTDLPAIYQAADIFVYPSLYEGFGIPIIEAQYSSVPVITSNISSMPEAAGEHSLLVNPNDIEQIANAIKKLLEDTEYRREVIARGEQFVRRFSEENFAKGIMSVYEKVLG